MELHETPLEVVCGYPHLSPICVKTQGIGYISVIDTAPGPPEFYIASHVITRRSSPRPRPERMTFLQTRNRYIHVIHQNYVLCHQTPFPLLCNSTSLEKWVHVRAFVYLISHLARTMTLNFVCTNSHRRCKILSALLYTSKSEFIKIN